MSVVATSEVAVVVEGKFGGKSPSPLRIMRTCFGFQTTTNIKLRSNKNKLTCGRIIIAGDRNGGRLGIKIKTTKQKHITCVTLVVSGV